MRKRTLVPLKKWEEKEQEKRGKRTAAKGNEGLSHNRNGEKELRTAARDARKNQSAWRK